MRALFLAGAAMALVARGVPARAEALRLRGEALAGVASPVGLVTIEASARARPWLRAEAVVWTGAGAGAAAVADADALVIAIIARDPRGRGMARLGRFVASVGALRPLHLDGAQMAARLPHRIVVDVFGGIPVEASEMGRAYDWVVGARLGRLLGDWGSLGVGWTQRRDHGRLADEEVALDAGGSPASGLDVAGRVSIDLVTQGVSEASLTGGARRGALRGDLFTIHRSPARLLPATSLFSVLGDAPSRKAGGSLDWRAAPRLTLRFEAAVRAVGGDLGEDLGARAMLRLGDDADSAVVAAEARRDGAGGWTGARLFSRLPLGNSFGATAELELVVPDAPRGRGAFWPWALAALDARPAPLWDVGVAVEAGATPEHSFRLDVLGRVARRWEVP